MAGLDGDLLVLGAGGKMGLSFAAMAARSLRAGGVSDRRVIAVSVPRRRGALPRRGRRDDTRTCWTRAPSMPCPTPRTCCTSWA
ncbi:MAG: hypothetical protein R3C32_03980 [Chloroflexota bacterium]